MKMIFAIIACHYRCNADARVTKQAAIQTSTYLCTSIAKKFTQFQNKNKGRHIHKANVMTHQTVHQTELFCHTLPVVLFFQFCVYKKQTQRPGGSQHSRQYVDNPGLKLRTELCNAKLETHQGINVFRAPSILIFVPRETQAPPTLSKHPHLPIQCPVAPFLKEQKIV